jgi:hypothetical protein
MPVWAAILLVVAGSAGLAMQLQRGEDAPDFVRPATAAPTDGAPAAPGDAVSAAATTPAEAADSPAAALLEAALARIEERNLTLPEDGNAHDSVLAAVEADPKHPGIPSTADALIDAYAAEIVRHLRGGNAARASDYRERAAEIAAAAGRDDGPAMARLRRDALAAITAGIDAAASAFNRQRAVAIAAHASAFGATPAEAARLSARAEEILQSGDRIPDDAAGAVLVRHRGGLIAAAPREVTRGEYARFARATGRPAALCRERISPLRILAPRSWQSPGFQQNDGQPVVCVSWSDADAYARWLSQRSGKRYRLPDAGEFQAAATVSRGGAPAVAEWLQGCGDSCRQRFTAGTSWQGARGAEPRDADRGYPDVGFRVIREL